MESNEIIETNEGITINNFKATGIKEEKYGVALIWNENLCETAAVFTKNSIKANPVILDIKKIRNKKDKKFRAIIINSGNANACVDGMKDAEEMCKIASEKFKEINLNINEDEILVASTGIIGKKLDIEKIRNIVKKLNLNDSDSKKAAMAIMTTDKKIKEISLEYKGIKIGGIEKGAGMISPNMATMLCFLTTNADFDNKILQKCLTEAVENSFNKITVDGCMSTNDTVILLSDRTKKCNIDDFKFLLNFATLELAKKIVKDGEGATKFIEILVKGAKTRKKAINIARAIANSNLVKTAFFGENLNWGRIVSAAGSVGKINFEKISLKIEDIDTKEEVEILEKGILKIDKEKNKIMKGKNLKIVLNLNEGNEEATIYTCDLSFEYV
ncbi:MAG: bifunctional ornithine acetyltransferase/N-acetylglutamate synthase, partial [Candidatus Altarchaeaceae archaeon]